MCYSFHMKKKRTKINKMKIKKEKIKIIIIIIIINKQTYKYYKNRYINIIKIDI